MARKRRLLLKLTLGSAAALVFSALAAYGWLQYAPRRVPAGQPPLETLHPDSLSKVRDAFNAGDGEVRVLAMLSPT